MATIHAGKYRGKAVSDIPLAYCEWAVRNMTTLTAEVRAGMLRRLQGQPERVLYFAATLDHFFVRPATASAGMWCRVCTPKGRPKAPEYYWLLSASTYARALWLTRRMNDEILADEIDMPEDQARIIRGRFDELTMFARAAVDPESLRQAIVSVGRTRAIIPAFSPPVSFDDAMRDKSVASVAKDGINDSTIQEA